MMAPDGMKKCKDCVHVMPDYISNNPFVRWMVGDKWDKYRYAKCTHPGLGQFNPTHCDIVRSAALSTSLMTFCGPEGRLFSPSIVELETGYELVVIKEGTAE
jgi:hypothetical protein